MLNDVTLLGRLATQPEIKKVSEQSFTSFRLAVERDYVDKNTGKREADFINIVAWRGAADFICKHFNKGKMIIIKGKLQVRSYKSTTDGTNRSITEVLVTEAFFAGDSKGKPAAEDGTEGDLPFPVDPQYEGQE